MNRLPATYRERYPDLPWVEVVAVRHRIVHAYFDLDWLILWNAAVEEIPSLRQQVEGILAEESPAAD